MQNRRVLRRWVHVNLESSINNATGFSPKRLRYMGRTFPEELSAMNALRHLVQSGGVLACVCAAASLSLSPFAVRAQERPAAAQQQAQQPAQQPQHSGGEEQKEAAPRETPIPPEKSSVTHHELTLGGKSLKYTATAGTLLIRDEEDKPYGSIFYVAYTLDGVDPTTRPVSFLYNGGPGSATLWLHMGSFSPVRIETDSPKATAGPPFKLVPNQYSLLDKTDLVFIDAPLTGYSRAVGKGQAKDFTGVDQDLKAFDRFIARYITVNQRWNSPKFLIGESYGTTRSAGLSDLLGERWDPTERDRADLVDFELCDPLARIRHDLHCRQLAQLCGGGVVFQQGAEQAAGCCHAGWSRRASLPQGRMRRRCFQGTNLPAAQLDSVAKEMSRLTGLSVEYIKEANLRVSPTRFRKEVMRSDRRTLGRYDMRFEGEDMDAAGENPSYDASDTGITGAYVATIHDYLERELKYGSTDTYRPSAGSIGQWDWKHRPAGSGPGPAGAAAAVCGRRSGGGDPQESAPEGVFGERIFRPGDAVFCDRVRPGSHGPGAGAYGEMCSLDITRRDT